MRLSGPVDLQFIVARERFGPDKRIMAIRVALRLNVAEKHSMLFSRRTSEALTGRWLKARESGP